MNETPERICEALAWLYGGAWAFDGETLYTSTEGDWMELDEDHTPELHRDCWMRDCAADLAHALAVTAPWEWTGRYARVPSLSVESVCFRVGPDDTTENDRFTWMLSLANGPTMQDSEFTEDAAKTAARTAYLTWMRGRFAMKGGVV